jgi:hypothetical protein
MKKPTVDWLDRSLVVGPYLTLVVSDAEFQSACDHLGIPMADRPRWIVNDHSDATVHLMTNKDAKDCHVVAVRLREGINGIQVAAMLVHEAVHIFQNFCESIGERTPSAEFEAYSIQAISQRLMEAYADRIA